VSPKSFMPMSATTFGGSSCVLSSFNPCRTFTQNAGASDPLISSRSSTCTTSLPCVDSE
jgi:hypothetical protein